MNHRRLLLLAGLLFSTGARAWEEEQAIAFILAWHPVVAAQRTVAASYQPPSLTRRVLEHTSFYIRAASGASSTVSEGGDATTTSPMTVGVQLNIPLASPREQREFAQQALSEATRIDEVRGRALTDLAKLRELEAERAALQERLTFYRAKADWLQERVKKATRAMSKSCGSPPSSRIAKRRRSNAWSCC